MIADNLKQVQQDIAKYSNQDVTLVAVTKHQTIPEINQVIALGARDIGENRSHELMRKLPEIEGERRIHFIGHLQRNKVRDIIHDVDLIHSLDSVRLARQIEREAAKVDRVVEVLVQVNIAEEEAKYGFLAKDLEAAIQKISQLEHVRIVGLMMMAPLVEDSETLRPYFRKMKELFDYYAKLNYNNVYMKYLSMGMTNDYKVALQEGSNMIRIGTRLFQ